MTKAIIFYILIRSFIQSSLKKSFLIFVYENKPQSFFLIQYVLFCLSKKVPKKDSLLANTFLKKSFCQLNQECVSVFLGNSQCTVTLALDTTAFGRQDFFQTFDCQTGENHQKHATIYLQGFEKQCINFLQIFKTFLLNNILITIILYHF